jgi:hypothetical protein
MDDEGRERRMIFYTYCYIDPSRQSKWFDEGEPIYIGKGKGNRAYRHLISTKMHPFIQRLQKMRRNGIEPIIKFLAKEVDDELACLAEKEAIDKFGRKDLEKGPLLNLTDGGEGPAGAKHSKEVVEKRMAKLLPKMVTLEYKQRMSEAVTKAQSSPEFKAKFSAIQKVAQNKPGVNERRKASQQRTFSSPEFKAKMSKIQKIAQANYIPIACPHCLKTGKPGPMSRWHFENCKHK